MTTTPRRTVTHKPAVVGIVARARKLTSPAQLDAIALRAHRVWKSPIRGPWLTSVFGSMLLVGIPVMFITGLVSYAAYDPRLAGNDNTPQKGILGFYLFNWASNPSWIYRVSQGIHVTLGLVLIPIIVAKLWSVIPKLFEFPPVRSIAHALERISLILLVGGVGLEFATGVSDIEYFYPWKFDFYDVHFYGAWAFMSGFVIHVCVKLPLMIRSLRSRSLRKELATSLADTCPEAPADLVAIAPNPPTISRRGILGLTLGAAATVFLTTAGETIRIFHGIALLSPRGRREQKDANDFEVNITFDASNIDPVELGESWRLEVIGRRTVLLSRAQLLAMRQTTAELPIACVEGWSTVQTWTGVAIVDLARLVRARKDLDVLVVSLEKAGTPYRSATLAGNQAFNPAALLALKVNSEDISPDHGFPARIIVPGAPGVHCTKWVRQMTFLQA
jgi:DMSO/TMAO reductase YedYZ molybdopterin-dependent catalytic subunit